MDMNIAAAILLGLTLAYACILGAARERLPIPGREGWASAGMRESRRHAT
jgi:hypothetical protein